MGTPPTLSIQQQSYLKLIKNLVTAKTNNPNATINVGFRKKANINLRETYSDSDVQGLFDVYIPPEIKATDISKYISSELDNGKVNINDIYFYKYEVMDLKTNKTIKESFYANPNTPKGGEYPSNEELTTIIKEIYEKLKIDIKSYITDVKTDKKFKREFKERQEFDKLIKQKDPEKIKNERIKLCTKYLVPETIDYIIKHIFKGEGKKLKFFKTNFTRPEKINDTQYTSLLKEVLSELHNVKKNIPGSVKSYYETQKVCSNLNFGARKRKVSVKNCKSVHADIIYLLQI
jgi:hypothetical protein